MEEFIWRIALLPDFGWPLLTYPDNQMHAHFPNWGTGATVSLNQLI